MDCAYLVVVDCFHTRIAYVSRIVNLWHHAPTVPSQTQYAHSAITGSLPGSSAALLVLPVPNCRICPTAEPVPHVFGRFTALKFLSHFSGQLCPKSDRNFQEFQNRISPCQNSRVGGIKIFSTIPWISFFNFPILNLHIGGIKNF